MKASGWAFDRRKEASELVAQDDTEKMSTVQEIMLKITDYLRRTLRPSEDREVSLQQFPSGRLLLVGLWEKDHFVVVRNLWRKVRQEATGQAFVRANW